MSSIINSTIANFKAVVTGKYVEFKGRASRSEYWLFVLAIIIINIAFSLLAAIFSSLKAISLIFGVLNMLVSLALLLPGLAVTVRRFHDIGKGGGWIFINLLPVIGQIWTIVLMAQESEPQTNRFGDQPE